MVGEGGQVPITGRANPLLDKLQFAPLARTNMTVLYSIGQHFGQSQIAGLGVCFLRPPMKN